MARQEIGSVRPLLFSVCARLVLCAIAPLLPAQVALGQGPARDKVDGYVFSAMRAQKIPGLSLAVVREGKIIKARGYGFANLELRVPATAQTIYESGSLGKQFTATAIMMLVEEGKIGLDEKITPYFRDAPATWDEITVRNLLSHTSGIHDYTNGHYVNLRQDYTEANLVRLAASLPMDFAPGTSWEYSNTNYVLLGILIHKVTGEFYGTFLEQRIFRPLGMTTTHVISETNIVPNRASGYDLVNGQWKNQEWVSPSFNTTADGSLDLSVLDLAKWDAALYTEKLLPRAALAEMWTIQKLNNGQPNKGDYGFGWFIHTANGHRLIEHEGAWQGFTTQISRYVDQGLTVIVLTNLDSAHSHPARIAHHVAGLYFPGVMPPHKPPQKP